MPTIIKRMNEATAMIGRSDRLNRLRSIIRNLPAPAEFCLILFVGFAPLIIIFQLPTAFQSKHLELTTGGTLAFPLVELVRAWYLALPTGDGDKCGRLSSLTR